MNELIEATKDENLKKVKYLVEQGTDNHVDNDYVLGWAAQNERLDIIKYLVKHGADIHAGDNCALKWATESNHFNTVRYLKSIYIEKYKEKFLCYNCVVFPCCTELCSDKLVKR